MVNLKSPRYASCCLEYTGSVHSVYSLELHSCLVQLTETNVRYLHLRHVNMIVDLRLTIYKNFVGFSLMKCDSLFSAEKSWKVEC